MTDTLLSKWQDRPDPKEDRDPIGRYRQKVREARLKRGLYGSDNQILRRTAYASPSEINTALLRELMKQLRALPDPGWGEMELYSVKYWNGSFLREIKVQFSKHYPDIPLDITPELDAWLSAVEDVFRKLAIPCRPRYLNCWYLKDERRCLEFRLGSLKIRRKK